MSPSPKTSPADGPARGPGPFGDLPLDVPGERELRRFRLVGAGVVAVAAAVVVALSPGARGWLCGGVSALFALGWAFSAARAKKRLRAPERWRLRLGRTHLALLEGPGRQRSVPWSEVRLVDVDEDRLVVVVHLEEGMSPVRIEPRYGGLGVYALAEAVDAARVAAGPDAPSREGG